MKTPKKNLHLSVRVILLVLSCLVVTALPDPGFSQEDPVQKGLEITQEADRRGSGFGDFRAEMRMVLVDRHGRQSIRQLRTMIMETADDGDMSLSVFDTPKDIKGSAFLTYSHKQGDDDQWLYLPALKRVKRIASRNKSGSFMGSEFAYEDIASQEVEKYTYRWLRDEILEGRDCHVVEQQPVDTRHSGYSRLVVWLDRQELRLWKVDYYDRKNALLKTLTVADYRKYLDRFWKADSMSMVNHQTGKKTMLYWSGYRFGTGLTERDFSKNSLKSIR